MMLRSSVQGADGAANEPSIALWLLSAKAREITFSLTQAMLRWSFAAVTGVLPQTRPRETCQLLMHNP